MNKRETKGWHRYKDIGFVITHKFNTLCASYKLSRKRSRKLTAGFLFIGLASLVWLTLRTGRKPSRITYPCQRLAFTNSVWFLGLLSGLFVSFWKRHNPIANLIRIPLLLIISGGLLSSDIRFYRQNNDLKVAYEPIIASAASPYLGRVIRVHDPDVSNWNGSGWYGDYVDQDIVNQMFNRGLTALTETSTIREAWQQILPEYQFGQKIAIKANFNNSWTSYGEDNPRIDALPQIVNAMVSGLKTIGVSEADVWIYDASGGRRIPDRFINKLFPGIEVKDRFRGATFDSADPSATIQFGQGGLSFKVTDILVEADYLIDMPIIKRHSMAGVTLSFKNHLGSMSGSYGPIHPHINIYDGSGYNPSYSPLVDIWNNPNIRDKTVLIVGDGIFGASSEGSSPLTDGFNSLFISTDPVAVDSVMIDWLETKWSIPSGSDDYLYLAAVDGLGTYERSDDFQYELIDYREVTINSTLKGDLNLDNQINQLDILLSIEVILGTENDPGIQTRADINEDNTVDALDLQEIVNIVSDR